MGRSAADGAVVDAVLTGVSVFHSAILQIIPFDSRCAIIRRTSCVRLGR